MAQKKLKRITRSSPLNADEAARETERRRKIMEEFPPLEPSTDELGDISEVLRSAIEHSPKSVYQICKEAGVAPIVVSRFLSRQRDIRLATADRLARALGVAICER
jgi:hypothetical protein